MSLNRSFSQNQLENLVFTKKIGHGCFGQVYQGEISKENTTQKQQIAIKLETNKGLLQKRNSQLFVEAQFYQILQEHSNQTTPSKPTDLTAGIPKTFHFEQKKNSNILIMELLGPSLEDAFELCNRKFSLKTVVMLGIQMITRIEYLHKCNMLHRDIKPSNFAIGKKLDNAIDDKTVYILDLGLSAKYMDENNQHIPYSNNCSLVGNVRYSSINNHLGVIQTRRDDLESLGYVLIYFLLGKLPWQAERRYTCEEEMLDQVLKRKLFTTSKNYHFYGVPEGLEKFILYCRKLAFYETPDYEYLRQILYDLAKKDNFKIDFKYDWCDLIENWDEFQDGSLLMKIKSSKMSILTPTTASKNNDCQKEFFKCEATCFKSINPFTNNDDFTDDENHKNCKEIQKFNIQSSSIQKECKFMQIVKDFAQKMTENDFDWFLVAEQMAKEIFGGSQKSQKQVCNIKNKNLHHNKKTPKKQIQQLKPQRSLSDKIIF